MSFVKTPGLKPDEINSMKEKWKISLQANTIKDTISNKTHTILSPAPKEFFSNEDETIGKTY